AIADEVADPMPPDRAVPVVLEMIEPVRRLHQRRPVADDRIGKPGTVVRGAEAHLLGWQRVALRRLPHPGGRTPRPELGRNRDFRIAESANGGGALLLGL